jgi:drug/metabolite transporter (DMT)-like permease
VAVKPDRDTSASTVAGIALMAMSALTIPIGDGIAKELSATHSPLFISWARYAVACAVVLPLALMRFGASPFPSTQIGAHVLRTLFLIASMTLYFMAVARIPMATAISAFFVGPIVAMALAVIFLGEPLTMRKVVSLGLGVAGTLIIVRPGEEAIDAGLLLALGSGALFALYMIATRQASQHTDPIKTLAFQCAVGAVLLVPQAVWTWSTPAGNELWLFAALGLLSAVSHIMSITAFRYAQASTLAPIVYLELLGSVLIGYLAFGDVPGATVWLGAGAIVLAGVILLQRKR